MNLGNAIRLLRKQRNMTQEELGAAIDRSGVVISNYETNRFIPRHPIMEKIGQAMDIPVSIIYFLALEDNDIKPEKKEAFNYIIPPIKAFISELFNISIKEDDSVNG